MKKERNDKFVLVDDDPFVVVKKAEPDKKKETKNEIKKAASDKEKK